jgi:hypothetical protein
MNTQTHALMGAVFFGRALPRTTWAGALGGLTPDIPMLSIVATLKLSGVSDGQIFDHMYWENWWQITNGIAHSFLLWGALVVAALVWRHELLLAFSAAALLHAAIDFCVHREDAHMHFWPLTRWKFMSPVSYYDPAHYGRWVSAFEAIMGLALMAILFARFHNWPVRAVLAVAMMAYVAVPAYFILT